MMGMMAQVINLVVDEILAPAVARTGDIDGVVQNVKYSVASYVHHSGLPPEILAKHFGKSERSIYRYFERVGKVSRRRGGAHEGAQLMARILEFYACRKTPITAEVCVRYIRKQAPEVSPAEISGLLDLYATLGHLRKITEEVGGVRVVRFQTPDDRQGASNTILNGELQRMAGKLRVILPLVVAHARQEKGAGMHLWRGRVTPEALQAAMVDIDTFVKQRWERAQKESELAERESGTEGLDTCVLVMGGSGSLETAQLTRRRVYSSYQARTTPPTSVTTH